MALEEQQENQLHTERGKVNSVVTFHADPSWFKLIGIGWRGGFILSAAEQWLKLELTKNIKLMKELELLPNVFGQDWSGVFLQRFDGAVTYVHQHMTGSYFIPDHRIWPRTKVADWFHILSDPSREELGEMIKVGQRVTWPKVGDFLMSVLHCLQIRSYTS